MNGAQGEEHGDKHDGKLYFEKYLIMLCGLARDRVRMVLMNVFSLLGLQICLFRLLFPDPRRKLGNRRRGNGEEAVCAGEPRRSDAPAAPGPRRRTRHAVRPKRWITLSVVLMLSVPAVFPSPLVSASAARIAFARASVGASVVLWSALTHDAEQIGLIQLAPGKPAEYRERFDLASKMGVVAALIGAASGSLVGGGDDALLLAGTLVESICFAYGAKTYGKRLFHRPRPCAPHEVDSFPSGHAAVAWSAAAAISMAAVRNRGLVPSAAVATGAALAASVLRVISGAHYPGDVAAGAVVGIAVGAFVSGLSLPSLREGAAESRIQSATPGSAALSPE